LIQAVRDGQISVEQAVGRLSRFPYEQLDFACIDHHRQIRRGFGEVIFCPGKSTEQIVHIFTRLAESGGNVLATRAEPRVYEALAATKKFPHLRYEKPARAVVLEQKPVARCGSTLPIVTAGTADLPVAEEARVTAELMGQRTELICDVGVAGLHRLLVHLDKLQQADVIVVVAGMEGALAGVVAGLVSSAVIAVPTSVGYGTSFGGIAALLTMLNSCAAGVAVVNIDNGFSAAVTASLIKRRIEKSRREQARAPGENVNEENS